MWRSILLSALTSAASAQYNFSTSNWNGVLDQESGLLRSLRPTSDQTFDFSPSDYFDLRNGVGNYHTGDMTLRWRVDGQTEWNEIDTAASRASSPASSPEDGGSILRSNYDSVFPEAAQYFSIDREWLQEDDDLILRATISNRNASSIEIGAFGFPIEFNSIFTNRTADETTAKCVLVDPYIGLDAGYLQATRLTGTGPNLIVVPSGNQSKFEAWRFLDEDPSQPTAYQSQVFEGLYAWQTLSKAYAENEWNATEPWNVPTSTTLRPGEVLSFGLRFGLAQEVHDIEASVASKNVPVAIGVPGYVLPADLEGRLFIDSTTEVQSIAVEPEGALTFDEFQPKNTAWKAYKVTPSGSPLERVRVTIQYADGKLQTVHYFVTDTTSNTNTKFADFLFDEQWYTDASDPFHRAPSVISYDHDTRQQVLQENRAWIAGISDEGGAGSFEAAAMKVAFLPEDDQVRKLEEMANTAVWGWLQDNVTDTSTGEIKYGVKRSLFFYDPAALPDFQYDPSIDWNVWSAWNKADAYAIWRAYDYVHVSALYWALYNAERASSGVLTLQNATWYLLQAYETVLASQATNANGTALTSYADVGLMCETVWLNILTALKAESLDNQASKLEAAMQARSALWSTQSEPFGSEMAWDSTGQEGVYLWSRYFNDTATVQKTLNSIRGYMPTVAHWGWNGNARRYWDFLYGGKLQRYERMLHHYGSGLNALPLLDAYKRNAEPSSPAALYDLRVAYGGNMGPLTNIRTDDGFGAMAFHSFPDTMRWDAYSGDYGPNYLGHVLGACTYLVDHPDFGLLSFGGNIDIQQDGAVVVQPKDTVKRRIYVAPLGLAVEFDAGVIQNFTYEASSRSVTIDVVPVDGQNATVATMVFEDTLGAGVKPVENLSQRLDGFSVSLPGSVKFVADS